MSRVPRRIISENYDGFLALPPADREAADFDLPAWCAPPSGPRAAFWAVQAERLLADHLWREGALPPALRLEVADVSRDDLEFATSWKDE